MTIDPSLYNAPSAASRINSFPGLNTEQPEAPCNCLSVMYLTLLELQMMASFAFPGVIQPQRQAMATASTIIHCDKCPLGLFSSISNTQSVSSLLTAIAERFHKALKAIDAEAEELE